MNPVGPAGLPASSLIIASRNRPDLLHDTVQSILRGDETPSEVIIIDQSDQPHLGLASLTCSRGCKIRYTWTPIVGLGRARNAGILSAQHEILAITDDDMWATPGWFGSLIRSLVAAGSKAVVTGQVQAAAGEVPSGFAPSLTIDRFPKLYKGRAGKDVLWTSNMAMYRSAIDSIGLFDDRLGPGSRFPSAEDNDYGFRLLEACFSIVYVPEALLYHRAWRSKHDYLRLRWNYGRGQGAFYAKYFSLQDRYMLWRFVESVRKRLLHFSKRVIHQRHLAYGDAIYLLGLLSGTGEWLLTRRLGAHIQRARR